MQKCVAIFFVFSPARDALSARRHPFRVKSWERKSMKRMKNMQGSRVKLLALFIALIGWSTAAVWTGGVKADTTPVVVLRTAVLTNPAGGADPHGVATWKLYQSGNRELEVEVENTRLAKAAPVDVTIDGNVVGRAVVDTRGRARLKLSTELGQAVPNVNDGSTVSASSGVTVLVNGTFSGGGPAPSPTATPTGTPGVTPSPTPSVTPNPGNLFASLTGPTLNGAVPTGYAEFELDDSGNELEVRVRQVNLPIGTSLNVSVNGVSVGTITLGSGGEGRLKVRGGAAVSAGSTISIMNGDAGVLSGTFSLIAGTPAPTPTPGGTPGPSPSPSPTPAFGRSFEANLTGAGVVPAVTTAATGEFKVTLSADETQATMFGEFHNLSSAQTGARVEISIGTPVTLVDLGTVGGVNGRFLSRTFAVSAADVQALRAGLWSAVITSTTNPAGEIRGSFRPRRTRNDVNGDGRDDIAVFRPSSGDFYVTNADGFTSVRLGSASSKLVSGDYDGDGRTDLAVFDDQGGQGVWNIRRSSDGGTTSIGWGLSTDVPVRGDFDGDGRLDAAVYRASSGTWFVNNSDNTGWYGVQFGLPEDKPQPMDMDGDGKDDIVVFRPSNGDWYWLRSSDGRFVATHWGASGDMPVSGDFDGDGRGDVAVFRPSTGDWYYLRSSDGQFVGFHFGMTGDVPVAADYDGDGKIDIAVFRPSDGNWYVSRSSDGGFEAFHWGMNGDVPMPSR
jgi:hypothetical protein